MPLWSEAELTLQPGTAVCGAGRVNNGGPDHDSLETRWRMGGAQMTAEVDRWRELPPAALGSEPPPWPMELARLL